VNAGPLRSPDEGRDRTTPRGVGGLCPNCAHVQRIASAKGSTFLLCTLSKSDPRFPKYPPQPVLACSGFAPGREV
jgi:hypothetical protein